MGESNRNCEEKASASVSEANHECRVDDASRDSLRNTPTNIARLEDVIEQCKARQKYHAQTASPSDGGDVRWYFCKVPLAIRELAASIPCTEVVGKGHYFRFGMRDSLAIEASFLQREEELLSSWWREYAECSDGPKGRPSSSATLDSQGRVSSSEVSESDQVYIDEEERVGVPVKGGLYEVDLVKRHCFPVYWDGENRRVLRGHWFARKGGLDWLPLREDISEQLEFAYRSQVWHRRTFQPSGLFAARVDLQGSTPGLHALFTGEDDTWEAWLNTDAFGVSSVIGFGGNTIKLRRGYSPAQSLKPTQDEIRQQKEEEVDDYCSQVPVRHLVFMVHGIGQRLEKSNLIDDVGNFRLITGRLAELHLSSYQRDAQRVLFIPCQWRRGLKLSGETAVEKITLDGVRGLRVMLSATVHDVLYYMSPIYCQDIINSVSNQLNRLYLKFLKRNPGYDGKVSIYGHSLGSVLSYDILCHQENLSSPFPMEWMYKENARNTKSPPDVRNKSPRSDPICGLEEKGSNTCIEDEDPVDLVSEGKIYGESNNSLAYREEREDEDTVDLFSEGKMSGKSNSLAYKDKTEDCCNAVDLNAKSILEECSSKDLDANQQHCSSTVEEDAHEHDSVENLGTEVPKELDEKDKSIKLCMDEIALLKDKIVELELQCAASSRGNMEVHTDYSKKLIQIDVLSDQESGVNYRPYIKYTKLEFKVDTFFAVGSPLGVFLALRNVRIGTGEGREYWAEENIGEEMPACRKMLNIFHPFDPVAYRLEPLICKEYIGRRPVIIPYHRGGKRLHIGFQDFTEDLTARSQAVMTHLNSVRIKVLTVCQSREENFLEDATKKCQERAERSYGSTIIERLTGSEDGRVDHMLQDKTFQHAYISAIGAHTNYWRDYDTALFILKHLYQDIPEEPSTPTEESGVSCQSDSGHSGWLGKRDDCVDEEQPLTFSDEVFVKSFSRKAKKILKRPK